MYVGESETGSLPWPGQTLVASPSSHSKDTMEGGLERVLNKAVEALSLSMLDNRYQGVSSSRIYVNFLPHLEEQSMVAAIAALKTKLSDFISRESATLLARRVDD